MKAYLIIGLRFDNRIFEKLELNKLQFEYINWIDLKENESIKDYVWRLSKKMDDGTEEIVLISQSLGGIMAQEIA